MRMARPGPGNGWRHTSFSGRPSSRPTWRTSSLNSERSGSTSANSRRSGNPTPVWWDLMDGGTVPTARLDHVGVERALHEVLDVLDLRRLLLEHADELGADDLALRLRIGLALQTLEQTVLRIDCDERHLVVVAERGDHLVALVLAHQPVVDEHAGDLVADRLVHEQRCHR